MRESIRNISPEMYFAGSAVFALLIAAVLTRIPALSFGSFWLMAGALIGGDVVVYILMKLGWLKWPGAGNRAA